MSQYYNPKRTRNLYDKDSATPFKVSRSKIDLFLECPRCFYLDRRLGVARPPGFPFSLNAAVDHLLKKEFDVHRAGGTSHPLMETYGIDVVPFEHKKMNEWRDTFKGVQALHKDTNLLIFGAVDDIWVDSKGELYVVDYKATAKDGEVTLDADWQDGYKRQMEVYQWLLRENGMKVSDTGYFVYANGDRAQDSFDKKLVFNVIIIPYTGSDSWIEKTIKEIKGALDSAEVPDPHPDCDYCAYRKTARDIFTAHHVANKK